jgi:hypothetical protein
MTFRRQGEQMKTLIWLVVAAVGWAMMLAGYSSRTRLDDSAPWSSGLIVIGPVPVAAKEKDGGNPPPEKTTSPKAAAPEAPAEEAAFPGAIPVRVRLLSTDFIAELIMMVSGDEAPDKAVGTKAQVRVKLIEVPLEKVGLGASVLQSGRLPEAGRDEIIAGARIERRDQLLVGSRTLKVVGVLKPDVLLFADSLLIPPSDSASELFPAVVPSVWHARLVRMPAGGLKDEKTRKDFEKAFPAEKYVACAPLERLERQPFYLYVAGLALFLLGGSGVLIGFFRWIAGQPGMSAEAGAPFFAQPLLEMSQRPRLLWAVHLVYFGIVIAGSVLIYDDPAVQAVLLENVGQAFAAQNSPLAVAGRAYLSGSIPLAALVTFIVNFFLGSLAYITLPSVLLFGAGLLLAWVRALAWGLLLAPTIQTLAYSMLPHSGTMLLEGEGYILAAFFGFLIPIHTVSSRLGGNPLARWRRAFLLNLKANFWIALVLAVSAIYEATEVILMNR